MIDYKKLDGLRVLVTGGAGFIGSNICETLIDHNVHVTCLDNLSTGHKKNIESLMLHENFDFIQGDIRDLDLCQRACADQDFVLHQAASVSVPRSIDNPILCNSVNVDGFLNMLTAARDNKVRRFIFATSSSVYGDSVELPKIESNIGKPLSPYALSKLTNELYAQMFYDHYGLEFIGLRYFNVFGPKQDPESPYSAVIPLFTKKLINGDSPVINGDGSFSRDFTYIDNVVSMNLLAMLSPENEAVNEIYNVACGTSITLKQLAAAIKEELSKNDNVIKNIPIKYGPPRNGDIPHSRASIEKAKRLLNYNPKVNTSEGISRSVMWYWKELQENSVNAKA